MSTLVTPANGEDATAESVAQLTEMWSGLRNIPTSHFVNDAGQYAETIKNTGTGSKGLIVYAADGSTVLLQVDGNGVRMSASGGAAVTAATLTGSETLTNKTLTAPSMTAANVTSGGLTVGAGGASITGLLSANTGIAVASGLNVQSGGLIVTAGGLTVTAGGLTVTAGTVTMSGGSVVAGQSGLANGATDGFLYVASGGGTPTGTPTAQGSNIPTRFNTADSKHYAYIGGTWKSVQYT